MDDDGIELIHRALSAGELTEQDLSTRRLAGLLGKTTGAIYHRWGSLDGLLFAVSQRGFVELGARVSAVWARTRDLGACAAAFVDFGLDQPELYSLMFERRFDWAALRAAGVFERATPGSELLARVLCLFEQSGSKSALSDTRLFMAGLHGVVSFAASGRMNTGELSTPDRAVALRSARDLASRLLPRAAKTAAPPSPKPSAKKRARS